MLTAEEFNDLKEFDIDLLQREVDGGKITVDLIDTIAQFPNASSIRISGLDQKTFEYFIDRYASRFQVIVFWKNKNLIDLSPLEKLPDIEYLKFFNCPRITSLWDLQKNPRLRALSIYDFPKLKSISGIENAPALEYLDLGSYMWGTMEIDSLKPVVKSPVTYFAWYGKKVKDGDFHCLSKSNIKTLDMNVTKFSMGELASLLAAFPEDLKGKVTVPYIECTIQEKGDFITLRYLCKRKGYYVKGSDDKLFEKYLESFQEMLEKERKKNNKKHL